jgi:hypothetical protein
MSEDTVNAANPRNGADGLEVRITEVGKRLADTIGAVIADVPGRPNGPQALAKTLGLDKVLTSRVLKATRSRDPMAFVHHSPGPEPLRRLLRAARKNGVGGERIRPAVEAVEGFERLIRQDIGDRSALDAIISAWLPEARRDFELRRKQSAFKAMSQLKGVQAQTNLSTVILNPSDDDTHIDIVWLFGLLGVQRLRPGVTVKFTSRRMANGDSPRQPVTLDGRAVEGVEDARLDQFCDAPPAVMNVTTVGDVVHYTLADPSFGPRSAFDLVLGEANLREIARYVPRALGRKGNVFAEVGTPVKSLLFDVLVHEDVYPASEPTLFIYDTALEGVADVNERSRDIDRLDMIETIQMLGRGAAPLRIAEIPTYVDLLRYAFDSMGWADTKFRAYRCRIDYPVYGSQVVVAFDPPSPPAEQG